MYKFENTIFFYAFGLLPVFIAIFIWYSYRSKKNLKKIAESFNELSVFLLNNNIGHGDLKHDNIIVDENYKMKLFKRYIIFCVFFLI